MLLNLLYGLPVMVICLLLQAVMVAQAVRYYSRRQPVAEQSSFWTTMALISGVLFILVVGNLAQVLIWALLYHFLGEFSQFSQAVYHSAVNFTTLGYGDIVMSEKHRLLGPLEALNGVLMIGVSSAAFLFAFQDALNKTLLAEE